ncbi:hypothetical protein AB7M17_006023 [Bradyrhizobium sp. USDA 377]
MSSLVAIKNARDVVVGTGILVKADRVLTCAHVVNVALGRTSSEASKPGPNVAVSLAFEVSPAERRSAVVADEDGAWSAPPASGIAGADICLLRLREVAPTSAKIAKLRVLHFDKPFEARVSGFPQEWNARPNAMQIDFATIDVVGQENNLWMLRAAPAAANAAIAARKRPAGMIHAGFSGGPVDRDGEVIAIAAEARPFAEATAYAIPVSRMSPAILDSLSVLPAGFERIAPHAEDLFAGIRARRRQLSVELNLSIRLCPTYDAVLATYRNARRADSTATQDEFSALSFAELLWKREPTSSGRRLSAVLLSSPGGAGKSSFLERLVLAAPAFNLVPFYVDFASATRPPRETTDAEDALRDWFGMCATGDYTGFRNLARREEPAATHLRPLLILDGLNQAKIDAERVLALLAELLSSVLPYASVVVSDRLILRQASDRFDRAAIAPLCSTEILRGLQGLNITGIESDAGWQPLLSSPFYLNQLRLLITRSGPASASGPVPSRFTLLDSTLREVHRLHGKERNAVAEAAFQLYRLRKSTAFDKDDLQRALEAGTHYAELPLERAVELAELLVERGLVHPTTDAMEFSHQLLHDFLAASRIAATTDGEDADLLRAPAFDALSLNAASPDAIEMAVEALETSDWQKQYARLVPLDPRRFLTEVYDWNYWITLQVVMSLDRRQALSSPHLRIVRHAIYALNVEKRFDLFVHSSERIKTILEQLAGSTAVEFVKSESLTELTKLASEAIDPELSSLNEGRSYWQNWLSLYLGKLDEYSMIDSLWRDPLIGWTAANVLRRGGFGESTISELFRLYRISRSTSDRDLRAVGFRWRLVHALSGAQNDSAATDLVAVALDLDEDPNVRYGAVRSAIEIAALRGSDGGLGVLGLLTESLHLFFAKDDPGRSDKLAASVRQQLRRCCAINEPSVPNKTDRVPIWKNRGLEQYQKLLTRGENLATGQEKSRWASWLDAVAKVRATGDGAQEWPARQKIWMMAVKAEN